jgi:pimeloyl-ACP methyl ester carboxylesterase
MLFVPFYTLVALAGLPQSPAKGDAPNAIDKAESRYAEHDGVRVHYKSIGSGTTALVFVHGWSCDLSFWEKQVPAFDGKVRMIFIDLPGHGKSDKPQVAYTMDRFATAVDAVLTNAGVDSAVLAGHSMGMPVIRQYYRLFPKKTRALIAVDGSVRPFTTDEKQIEQMVNRFKGPDFKPNVERFVNSMFPADAQPDLRKSILERMTSTPQHVAVSAMKEMMDPANWKDDPIKVPFQMILAKSPFWTADYEQYVRKLAPEVDYRMMDGVGHFLHMERPDEFNKIMAEFLRQQGVVKP